MAGKYQLITLGCKVNQYESQQIRELLDSMGLRPADPHETPDVAVVNTCAVTASASRKSRQLIRRAAHNGAAVFVVGCGVSAGTGQLFQLDGVVATVGHELDVCAALQAVIAAWLEQTSPCPMSHATGTGGAIGPHPGAVGDDVWMRPFASDRNRQAPQIAESPTDNIFHGHRPVVKTGATLTARIRRFAGHQRAFLKVQDGCDAFCTYCLIPRLRPALRSKPLELAVAEAQDLVRAGHREIVITGVFLGAYGRDTAVRRRYAPRRPPLCELVAALAEVNGLERLRLSSLEPGDVDESLLELLASRPNCVPHLHLPLQSGSGEILGRMNRQYTRADYLGMIRRVRAALDRPAITTDIIVGFPGETDEDFEASRQVARDTRFAKIHAFPFSPREGTAAARWRRQFVPPAIVRERMNRLAEVERECSLAFRQDAIGTVERVLVEADRGSEAGARSENRIRHGRTDRYFAIHFEAPAHVGPGDLVRVCIQNVTATHTFGTYLPSGDKAVPPGE